MEEALNELHLFAGAGGGILGGILCGHTCVCAVEIEPYPRKVLLQRQRDGILPKFPIWDDIRTFDGTPWRGKVDVVCGGFPCQDISAAGKGAGITGERSGLWAEAARICRQIRPSYIFLENSPMLTIRGLGRVLGDLASMGYDARWGVLGADAVGLPHRRARIWVVADSIERRREQRKPKREAEGNISFMGEGQKPGCHQQWREAEPAMVGVGDALASRVDRLFAVGNGQVPAVAAVAWQILSQGGDQ
jgi:DNA (cytosine-5)-methyltransferase 1